MSISAASDPNAQKALEQLSKLKGCQAHITARLSKVDIQVFKKLGIGLTMEPESNIFS